MTLMLFTYLAVFEIACILHDSILIEFIVIQPTSGDLLVFLDGETPILSVNGVTPISVDPNFSYLDLFS